MPNFGHFPLGGGGHSINFFLSAEEKKTLCQNVEDFIYFYKPRRKNTSPSYEAIFTYFFRTTAITVKNLQHRSMVMPENPIRRKKVFILK